MARPRKSDEQKQLEGTFENRFARPDVPKPTKGIPVKPAHLSPKAAAVYDDICQVFIGMNVLTVSDGLAIEAACECYADLMNARAALAKHGGALTYETVDKGGAKRYFEYPEVGMVRAADAAWYRWLGRIGLTPTDRLKLKANDVDKDDNPFSNI